MASGASNSDVQYVAYLKAKFNLADQSPRALLPKSSNLLLQILEFGEVFNDLFQLDSSFLESFGLDVQRHNA